MVDGAFLKNVSRYKKFESSHGCLYGLCICNNAVYIHGWNLYCSIKNYKKTFDSTMKHVYCKTCGFVQCTIEQRPRTDCPMAVHWNRARSGWVTNRWLNSVTFADRSHLTSKQRSDRVMIGYWFHWRIRTYRQQWPLKMLCLSSYTWCGRSAPSDGSVALT